MTLLKMELSVQHLTWACLLQERIQVPTEQKAMQFPEYICVFFFPKWVQTLIIQLQA